MPEIRKQKILLPVAWGCLFVAFALFVFSFTPIVNSRIQENDVKKVQSYLHQEMESVSQSALELLQIPSRITSYNYSIAKNSALFVFKDHKLFSWTNDVTAEEDTLYDIDTTWSYSKLGTGWYVTRAYQDESFKIVVAVLVKTDYPFSNDILSAELNPALKFPNHVGIATVSESISQKTGSYKIYDAQGVPLFVIYSLASTDTWAMILRWAAVLLILTSLFFFLQNHTSPSRLLIIILAFISLRIILLLLPDVFTRGIPIFAPEIYAESALFPSLGDLFLHTCFLFFVCSGLYLMRSEGRRYVQRLKQTPWKYYLIKTLDIIGIIGFLLLLLYVIRSLVLNSTITMSPFHLSEVSIYMVIAYASVLMIIVSLFVIVNMFANNYYRKWLFLHNRYQIFLMFLMGAVTYTMIWVDYYQKEKEEQQSIVWAEKIVTEHDPTVELLFIDMETQLKSDTVLQGLMEQNDKDAIREFLQIKYFHGYMHYYEMKLQTCSLEGGVLDVNIRRKYDEQIAHLGESLSENSIFYFLNNYNGHISYLGEIKFPAEKGDTNILYLEFDSKLTPMDDGYPDLLLDESIMTKLEIPDIYSYAVYSDWKLVISYGDYHYDMLREINTAKDYLEVHKFNGYKHFFVRVNEQNVIVLSRPLRSILMHAAMFSYLFLPYAIILYLLLTALGWRNHLNIQRNTFRSKITILLLGSLSISMILQALITIWSGIEQYRSANMQRMDDKMTTVLVDLEDYLNTHEVFMEDDKLSIYRNLYRLSNSLHVDINLYDYNGKLFASSRPAIFEKHLQSRRMNSDAVQNFYKQNISRYVGEEEIGNSSYLSMYESLYNKYGKLIGYANLPYFMQKSNRADGIGNVITAIVNINVLLLILILLVGITLSNNISQPLQLIRQNMRKYRISKKLEYINYNQDDELGDLVYAYNHMIDVIEESALKIAQNERESAWREMARQIAHEIKNPLTPMRLSIQHLMRMKKENKEGWQDRFDTLAVSLLEQIETMSHTANEFSNFAKSRLEMPTQVEMNAVLKEQQSLFDNRPNISFELISEVENAFVVGRRDQLVRVFVNLITNAIQALDDKPDGHIRVSLREVDRFYYIAVEDNGPGVKPEVQRNLFTPNFTTKTSGSGLGLAISKNIINRKGGTIEYTSSVLGGACFLVKLPKQTL